MMAVTYHLKFLQMVENLPWKALYNQHSQPSSVLYDFGDSSEPVSGSKQNETFPNNFPKCTHQHFLVLPCLNYQGEFATAHHPLSQYHSPRNTLLTVQVCSSPTLSRLLPLRSTTALSLHEYTHLLTLFSSSTNPSFPLQVKLPSCREHHQVRVCMFFFLLQCEVNHGFKRCFFWKVPFCF